MKICVFMYVRKIAKKKLGPISFVIFVCPPVCLHGKNSVPAGRVFMKFDVRVFFRKSIEKLKDSLKSDNCINVVKSDRSQMTIWCMRITGWMPRTTNTHSECVIRIDFYCNNGCIKVVQCYVTRISFCLVLASGLYNLYIYIYIYSTQRERKVHSQAYRRRFYATIREQNVL